MGNFWFGENNERELLSLAIAGDLSITAESQKLISGRGCLSNVDKAITSYFKESDYTIVNLENPICGKGMPIKKTGPSLRSEQGLGLFLKNMGIDAVNLSNNHIMDFGWDGLNQTIKELNQNKIGCFGAGRDKNEAAQAYFFEGNGIKVALLGFAEAEFARAEYDKAGAAPLEMPDNYISIGQISQRSDFVIVFAHAGSEYQLVPSPRIQRIYRSMIDAGADLVVGCHPHVPQGIERYGKGFIFYCLGNFIFDYKVQGNLPFDMGYVLKVGFAKNSLKSIDIKAVKLDSEKGLGFITKQADFINYIRCVSGDFNDLPRLTAVWEQEVINLYNSYKYFLNPGIKSFLSNKIFGRKNILPFLNVFQCASHADVLHTILKMIHNGQFIRDADIQRYLSDLDVKLKNCYD
ncbi:CapA family protein [bacterium]|jgi:poly-gamma-glutamate synthesis protein (capsule biosynthesis protein)|nr:CapA family protein [bacterium]